MNYSKLKFVNFGVLLFLVLLFSCKSDKASDSNASVDDILSVRVKMESVIQKGDMPTIESLGIVMSETEAKPSFKTGGIINATYVKEGDLVKKGELLATLIMDEIDAQVKLAEEALKKAERDMNRIQSLFTDSVATLEQVQNASTAFNISKRNVDIAKFNKSNSIVRSPLSGKVIKQLMYSGEITGPGSPIFIIMGVDTKDWIIKVGLIDYEWAVTNVGDKVDISFDAYPGQSFIGYISSKSSLGANTNGTFDVDIRMIKQPKQLAAGLISKTVIQTNVKNSLQIIPLEAIVKSNGSDAEVFTIINNKAKKLKLKIFKLLGDQVAIAAGLDGIEKVVTTGAMYLEDGDMVQIQ